MNSESHGSFGRKGSDESSASYASNKSHNSHEPAARPIVPPRGDYQNLLSYQKAEVVYDITFRFTLKFLSKGDRTVDQTIQSARSGKQNILVGSKAATASKETEIRVNLRRKTWTESVAVAHGRIAGAPLNSSLVRPDARMLLILSTTLGATSGSPQVLPISIRDSFLFLPVDRRSHSTHCRTWSDAGRIHGSGDGRPGDSNEPFDRIADCSRDDFHGKKVGLRL